MTQSKSTWKRHERTIATQLGTKRNGNTGLATADVSTPSWCIEAKSWTRLPVKVVDALRQAEAARTGHQTALAVLHQVGSQHAKDLVILRWADFAALLLGDAPEDRRTRAAVEMSDASDADRRIFTPDLVTA